MEGKTGTDYGGQKGKGREIGYRTRRSGIYKTNPLITRHQHILHRYHHICSFYFSYKPFTSFHSLDKVGEQGGEMEEEEI